MLWICLCFFVNRSHNLLICCLESAGPSKTWTIGSAVIALALVLFLALLNRTCTYPSMSLHSSVLGPFSTFFPSADSYLHIFMCPCSFWNSCRAAYGSRVVLTYTTCLKRLCQPSLILFFLWNFASMYCDVLIPKFRGSDRCISRTILTVLIVGIQFRH